MTLLPALVAVLLATGAMAGGFPYAGPEGLSGNDGVQAERAGDDDLFWTSRQLNGDIYRFTSPTESWLGRHWQLPLLRSLPAGDRLVWLPVGQASRKAGFDAAGDRSPMASYSLLGGADRFSLDVRTAVKPRYDTDNGIAGERLDWSLGAVLSKGFGPLAFSAAANRNLNTRLPGSNLRDSWSGEVYGGYGFANGSTVGLDFNYAQSAVPGADPSRVLSLSSTFVMTRREKLAFTLSHGLGNADANADLNVVYSHTFQ